MRHTRTPTTRRISREDVVRLDRLRRECGSGEKLATVLRSTIFTIDKATTRGVELRTAERLERRLRELVP